MAFNGDGPHNKRQRIETEQGNVRTHPVGYGGGGGGGGGDEPRRKRQDDAKPNHVLLFTIINPMYPITVIWSYVTEHQDLYRNEEGLKLCLVEENIQDARVREEDWWFRERAGVCDIIPGSFKAICACDEEERGVE
ncbi:hypothetical protein FQR65_LT12290 [Abscondita terminalis]|nr:hypothetical protein FQR65_LT12290 [Abscondita terminalis]